MTDPGQVAILRSFNRTLTERIGALNDRYLGRSRPLGASRLLWEIGVGGSEIRALRSRLGIDSGYLSRLLRSLESEGLVVTTSLDADARVRTVRLTALGLEELGLLDRLSDELAQSLLAPLAPGQRSRLVEAAATVERLLSAGLVDVRVEDPASDDAKSCIREYFDELGARFETGFDPDRSLPAGDEHMREPNGMMLVARLRGEPVGCGALRLHGGEPAEIKRMWVAPSTRGLGVGRRILGELESRAAEHGAPAIRLETNRALVEAIALYRAAGYREVRPFNEEPYAHHWFEKPLK